MAIIYINHLPKDVLLYELWTHARISPYFMHCKDKVPTLTVDQARKDINEMLKTNRRINLTTYYGKLLFVDITDTMFDTTDYEIYNRLTEKNIVCIINKLKSDALRKLILKFYIFR
jgi:hypothetical protein